MFLKPSGKPVIEVPTTESDAELRAKHSTSIETKSGYIDYITSVHEDNTKLTDEEKSYLRDEASKIPPWLCRTYSEALPRRTRGYNSPKLWCPSTTFRLKQECNSSMLDIPVGAASLMILLHLNWRDRNIDELLSWSSSFLFTIVLAMLRYHLGQGDCKIAFIDHRKATKARTPEHPGGGAAEFYDTLTLSDSFKVDANEAWRHMIGIGFERRFFTHEYLSHGVIEYEDSALRHVSFSELINGGFFQLYPRFRVGRADFPKTLYRRCVALRKQFFRRWGVPGEGSQADITTAWQLANLFVADKDDPDEPASGGKAPLHIFLMFLSLSRRPRSWLQLQHWVKRNYDASDIEPLLYLDMHKVPDNLDDVHQYLRLLQQCCTALNVHTDAIPDLKYKGRRDFHEWDHYAYRAEEKGMRVDDKMTPQQAEEALGKTATRKEKWSNGMSKTLLEQARSIVADKLRELTEQQNNGAADHDLEESFEQKFRRTRLNAVLEGFSGVPWQDDEDDPASDLEGTAVSPKKKNKRRAARRAKGKAKDAPKTASAQATMISSALNRKRKYCGDSDDSAEESSAWKEPRRVDDTLESHIEVFSDGDEED